MRVLFCTTAGSGHFGPMVPVARTCAAAGWAVAVAAPRSFAASVEAAGFEHQPFDEPDRAVMQATFARLPHLAPAEAERVVLADVFGRLDAHAALPGLTRLMRDWQPDLVVRDPAELGSAAAAAAAGVPQVQVAIGMARLAGAFVAVLAEALAELDERAGLPTGRTAAMLTEAPTLTAVPAAMDASDQTFHDGAVVEIEPSPLWRYRSEALTAPRLPAHWGAAEQPLVYVSFGSVTGGLGHFAAVYPKVVAALADLPVRALLTTGAEIDPATLGPIPHNTRIERWWPQADVMGAAAAVVGHGGFGTTMTALAYGSPQVVLPLFASDQYVHAERVEAAGLGIRLLGGPDALTRLPEALQRVLGDPAYAMAARRVADEMSALPEISSYLPALADRAR
jgi:MGT family glycosyltransferase